VPGRGIAQAQSGASRCAAGVGVGAHCGDGGHSCLPGLLSLPCGAMGRAIAVDASPAEGGSPFPPPSPLSAGCAVARELSAGPAPAVAGRIIRKI
jgi:hypothetical protein